MYNVYCEYATNLPNLKRHNVHQIHSIQPDALIYAVEQTVLLFQLVTEHDV